VLEAAGATIAEERSSGRDPLADADARRLLRAVDRVVVARGRRREEIPAKNARPKDLQGPTGGYRAPMVRIGGTLLVGLQLDTLRALIDG